MENRAQMGPTPQREFLSEIFYIWNYCELHKTNKNMKRQALVIERQIFILFFILYIFIFVDRKREK